MVMKNYFINMLVVFVMVNVTTCQDEVSDNKILEPAFSAKESLAIITLEEGSYFDFSFLDLDLIINKP